MEEELHETHVSFETAKLLKEAGFRWHCRGFFEGIKLYSDGSVECTHYESPLCQYLKAPTLDVAQKWLREVKKYHIYVRPYSLDDETYVTNIVITDSMWGSLQDDNKKAIIFKTYEDALEAGILKCLTLLLEKENGIS